MMTEFGDESVTERGRGKREAEKRGEQRGREHCVTL